MKKFTKLLSVFLIAGAVGTGVAGISACSNNTPEHTHTADTVWHTDANGHWHECTADDGAKLDEGAHVDANNDGKCDTCQYQMTTPVSGYVVESNTTGLKVEGITTTYNLSTSLTSASLDLTNIKVYLDNQGTKGKEVPAANYTVELYDGATKLTSMSGLKKDGTYTLLVTLVNAKKPDGTAVAADSIYTEVTITVNNAYTSLALKSGTTTQVQGANIMTADWTFVATRANGDTEDFAAADVEIGTLDTNTVGENKTVTITLKGTSVTGTVTYSITADATKVAQSYALNFGYLTTEQENAVKNGEVVSLQGGRFEFQSVSNGSIDSHNKEQDGKYFVKRLKTNGASTASGAPRYIKVTADGAGTLTIYAYNNGGTAGDGATRGVEVYSNRTASAGGDSYDGKIGETLLIPSKTAGKTTVTLPSAGVYYITATAGMTFCYVQLDQLVSAGDGVEEVKLGGETIVSKIEITKPDTVTNFKVGETFTHEGYTVTATGVNNVTCAFGETDVTAAADFVAPDMTTIGKKTVTVNYGGVSATYDVIVETAVDGIYGATASLKSDVNTQVDSADGKITLKNDDVQIALIGENAEATTTHVIMYNDIAIGEGIELGVGTYKLTVEVTVTAGASSDTIMTELEVLIDVSAVVGASAQFLSPDTLPAETAIAENATITENSLVKVVAGGAMEYSNVGSIGSGSVKITLADETSKTMGSGIRTAKSSGAGAATTAITFTAKSNISLRLYAVTCNDSYNSHKPGTLSYSVNGGTATTADTGASRLTPTVVEINLEDGDVLTLTAAGTNEGVRLYFFGLEATAI
ncbi:MAG: bacterial Ig-like domain-containing protein [Candidatus Coproplasma sp.]